MPQSLKIIAVLLCLVPWLNVAARYAAMNRPLPAPAARTADQPALSPAEEAQREQIKVNAMMVAAELGALILLIDAFRRQYDAPRAWPIAIAVLGLISFGASSLVYYAIWGRSPARPEQPRAHDFCDACKGETSDVPAPSAGTHNLVGTGYLGRFARCPACGSSIRTLWVWLLVPLVPLGSYRLLPIGHAQAHRASFIGRRAPWNVGQIVFVYVVLAAFALGVFWMSR